MGSPVAAGARLLPLRVDASGDPTFSELLSRTSEAVRTSSAHQELTLEELAAELVPEPDPSRHPLFQVAFLPGANLNGDGLDLELGLAPCETGSALAASYSSDLFDAATVRRLLGHLLNLLEGVAGEVDGIRVSELPLLGPEEREQVLVSWNGAKAERSTMPVHELAVEHARAQPEALAVSWNGGSLTYGELLRRSFGLASWLQERGIGSEKVVALRVE
ncbi:MAG TPA: AMP-binding protein, partial [Thermoanaerobaculia bacterium]|nr:AMP-binding protein [Thermoanaerobaculia bacterium]